MTESNSAAAFLKNSAVDSSLSVWASEAADLFSIMIPSRIKESIPSNIRQRPFPPASTTPAFLRTGSISGVLSRAVLAAEHMVPKTAVASSSVSLTSSPASQAILATVRIVPSVGFMTAL